MTHARKCSCCGDDPNPQNCPAPCLEVTLSGIQQLVGGRQSECWRLGGTPALYATPVNGTYLLNQTGGPTSSSYEARIPVLYSDVQATGGGDPPPSTVSTGGILVISAGDAHCENGIVTRVGFLNAFIEIYDHYYDDTGQSTGNRDGRGVMTPSGGPFIPGSQYQNTLSMGCDFGNTHFGGQISFRQPPRCTLPPIYPVAENCINPELKINFDPASIGSNPGIVESLLYSGELYRQTDRRSEDSPVGVEFVSDRCEDLAPGYVLARSCQNQNVAITIDPKTLAPNDITCVYNKTRFRITDEPSDGSPVLVAGSTDDCSSPGEDLRIARKCFFGDVTTIYDRAEAPSSARSGFWIGQKWELTNEPANGEPVPMVFAPFDCFDLPDCNLVFGPNDPLCDTPQYSRCPKCFNGTQIDPRPGDSFELSTEDPPGIFDFGDILKQAIKFATLNMLADCTGCERRRIILNKYGQILGRMILKHLKW